MGRMIELTASDGATIGAWRAEPDGKPRGAIVVLQEIFGVNAHIRAVADSYAAEGYLAIAPALFDRGQKGVDMNYGKDDYKLGFELVGRVRDHSLLDVEAAIKAAAGAGKVGIVGFCWGGALVWQAAAKLSGLAAGVGYYGGGILQARDLKPKIPVMLHFGEADDHIPAAGVRELAAEHPEIQVFLYPGAGHAFNRAPDPNAYRADAADLARKRTLDFLRQHVG